MSHVTQVRTQLTDQALVLKALEDLGYAHETGKLRIGGFLIDRRQVDIRFKATGFGIVGLKKTGGRFTAYSGSVRVGQRSLQKITARLAQRYAFHTVRQKLETQGFELVEQDEKGGRIHLTLRRAG